MFDFLRACVEARLNLFVSGGTGTLQADVCGATHDSAIEIFDGTGGCGSLVSLGEYSTVGNLMGNFVGGNLWLEGLFARWMYQSLYKMHEIALHGWWKTSLTTLARLIARQTEPRVKLH